MLRALVTDMLMRYLAHLSPFLAAIASIATATAQASWQLVYPQQSPPPNHLACGAFDEARGEGIHLLPTNPIQGWRWNGTTWAQLPGPMPPDGAGQHLVYDVARQRVVYLAQRSVSGNNIQDVWEWNGLAWQQQLPPSSPPGRDVPSVAYDRARGVTVMFGGGQLDDTWEWNGQVWTNPMPIIRPRGREQAVMAFDPTTQRVLLYGGFDSTQRFLDTWTWDGTTWQQQLASTPPYPRDRAGMAADLHRSRVVLYGGSNDIQTWEWDGTQWHSAFPSSPGDLRWTTVVYDTVRREIVLHGGQSSIGGSNNNTWIYRTPNAADASPFGAGCAGGLGVPVLANVPWHLPWLGDTVRNRASNIPLSSPGAFFVTSFAQHNPPVSLAAFGAPGCDLLLPTDSLEFAAAAGNTVEWDLAIPFAPWLAGIILYQQAFPIEQGANALGLTASNGLRLVIGIR